MGTFSPPSGFFRVLIVLFASHYKCINTLNLVIPSDAKFENLHNRPIIKKKEASFKTKLKISNSMRVNLKMIYSILFQKKFFLNSRFLTQNKFFELLTRKF